ncbi:MAG: sulfotransferase family 2 domain-containing protein [Promethearchaeota archaeon]
MTKKLNSQIINKIYALIYKLNHFKLENKRLSRFIHFFLNKLYLITYPFSNLLNTKNSGKNTIKIISKKYKFIFLEIPLVASKSFFLLFLTKPPIDFKAYMTNKSLEKIFLENNLYKSFFKFCIVRNPWSRIISFYNKKIMNANSIAKIFLLSQYKGLYPHMRFEDYIKWLCSIYGQDKYADKHWISQNQILSNKFGTPVYDHFMKLENLEEEFIKLCKKLDIPSLKIPHIGASKHKYFQPLHKSWINYYKNLDYDLLKKIEIRYKKDANLFNYPNLTSILQDNIPSDNSIK